jgi:AcrR family transcriptional regulator
MPSAVRRLSGQETRRRLLDSAIEYLSAGEGAVDFDAIAAPVGVTKGALYHHFGSADRLVETVYKEAIRLHAERVVAASEHGTGRERLQALIDASAMLYGSGTPFYRLLLRRRHLAPIAREVQRRQREYMTELVTAGQADGSIRSDIDPAALGETVNAVMQGLLVQQLDPPADQRRAAERFGDLLEVVL